MNRQAHAHYLVAFPTYGQSVDVYAREMREAQAIRLDAFASNVGAWAGSEYPERVRLMFESASQTGFKLYFSADMATLVPAQVVPMVREYMAHPNYLQYRGNPLLTTFMGQEQGEAFWRDVRSQIDVTFVPNFMFLPDMNPTYEQIKGAWDGVGGWWSKVADGLSYFGVHGTAAELVASQEAYAKLMKERGKINLASISPYYANMRRPHSWPIAYERHGGEGIAAQMASIVAKQKPELLMVLTWNDLSESYIAPGDPADMILRQYFYNLGPLLQSHAGYYELMRYALAWFKAGKRPAITRDQVLAFYRTSPLAAGDAGMHLFGDFADEIHITSLLTEKGEIEVQSGDTMKRFSVPKGMSHRRAPFVPGAQTVALNRMVRTRLSEAVGPAIGNPANFTTAGVV